MLSKQVSSLYAERFGEVLAYEEADAERARQQEAPPPPVIEPKTDDYDDAGYLDDLINTPDPNEPGWSAEDKEYDEWDDLLSPLGDSWSTKKEHKCLFVYCDIIDVIK